MKVAIVHDWLVTYAGAERVLEQIINLFPDADLFSLIDFLPKDKRFFIKNKKVKTSFIQYLPFAKTKYRNYLPLFPTAIESFDLSGYDLIISVSHCVAKGVKVRKDQKHICVCCTPVRYAWDLREEYLREAGLNLGFKQVLSNFILNYIKKWDLKTVDRVKYYIAISNYIAERIRKNYNIESYVIYPPVDVSKFEVWSKKEDFYLTASRMVPYKKIPLIARAFSMMPDKKLVIVGDGPEFNKVKEVSGKNIELLGYKDDEDLREYMKKARAFVFAAEEDFGIVSVEAQASGTPVIAYGKGGSLETVIDGKTGIFFHKQEVESIIDAVSRFERQIDRFDPIEIRKNAERFSVDRFKREFSGFVENII
ncbi:MAG: glycosyltransferase family 4 protein [Candidatus Omnitrophica bacterium]|nr:glycosyltransferase family 4 protein [Candidatus Omnitrophota bacterium]